MAWLLQPINGGTSLCPRCASELVTYLQGGGHGWDASLFNGLGILDGGDRQGVWAPCHSLWSLGHSLAGCARKVRLGDNGTLCNRHIIHDD